MPYELSKYQTISCTFKSYSRPLKLGHFCHSSLSHIIYQTNKRLILCMIDFLHDWFLTVHILRLCMKGYYGKKVQVLKVVGLNVHQIVWYFDSSRSLVWSKICIHWVQIWKVFRELSKYQTICCIEMPEDSKLRTVHFIHPVSVCLFCRCVKKARKVIVILLQILK